MDGYGWSWNAVTGSHGGQRMRREEGAGWGWGGGLSAGSPQTAQNTCVA
jgi:hypothetical protein